MPTSLVEMLPSEDPVFFNERFLNEFEDHIPYILRMQQYTIRQIDPAMGLKFVSDFNGLMMELGNKPSLSYPSLRLSGYTSSLDYDGAISFKIVDPVFYARLAKVWATQRKK